MKMCRDCPKRYPACQDYCEDMRKDKERRAKAQANKIADLQIKNAVIELTLGRNRKWR